MADIKTRHTVKGAIKRLDRASIASERMKRAYIHTKDNAENSVYASETTTEQYAAALMEGGARNISHSADHQVQRLGKNSVHRAKDDILQAQQAVHEFRKARIEHKENRIKNKPRESEFEAAVGTEAAPPYSAPKVAQERRDALKSVRTGSPDMDGRAVEQERRRVEQTVRTKRRDTSIRTDRGTPGKAGQGNGEICREEVC